MKDVPPRFVTSLARAQSDFHRLPATPPSQSPRLSRAYLPRTVNMNGPIGKPGSWLSVAGTANCAVLLRGQEPRARPSTVCMLVEDREPRQDTVRFNSTLRLFIIRKLPASWKSIRTSQ